MYTFIFVVVLLAVVNAAPLSVQGPVILPSPPVAFQPLLGASSAQRALLPSFFPTTNGGVMQMAPAPLMNTAPSYGYAQAPGFDPYLQQQYHDQYESERTAYRPSVTRYRPVMLEDGRFDMVPYEVTEAPPPTTTTSTTPAPKVMLFADGTTEDDVVHHEPAAPIPPICQSTSSTVMNSQWSAWSMWSTCVGGQRVRVRGCYRVAGRGPCMGRSKDASSCDETQPADIDAAYSHLVEKDSQEALYYPEDPFEAERIRAMNQLGVVKQVRGVDDGLNGRLIDNGQSTAPQ